MKMYNGFSEAQRNKAQRWLNEQWAGGRILKPAVCCACGQHQGVIDAHAEDYSEPFAAWKTDEFHLCFRCHMMVHFRFGQFAAWRKYREAIKAGVRFAPMFSRNFEQFRRDHLTEYGCPSFTKHKPQVLSQLDIIDQWTKTHQKPAPAPSQFYLELRRTRGKVSGSSRNS